MQLTNDEIKLLEDYQKWLTKNKINEKTGFGFELQVEKNLWLIFQTWENKEIISENVWLKVHNNDCWFSFSNVDEKFEKSYSIEEILKFEKEFVLKKFKIKSQL